MYTCKELNPPYIVSYDWIRNFVLQTENKTEINFTKIHLLFPRPGCDKAICNLLYHTVDNG